MEMRVKRAPETRIIRRLPTALTTPQTQAHEMPVAEIIIWTPARALTALGRIVIEVFGKTQPVPAREKI